MRLMRLASRLMHSRGIGSPLAIIFFCHQRWDGSLDHVRGHRALMVKKGLLAFVCSRSCLSLPGYGVARLVLRRLPVGVADGGVGRALVLVNQSGGHGETRQ
jgi:hypothetical protein